LVYNGGALQARVSRSASTAIVDSEIGWVFAIPAVMVLRFVLGVHENMTTAYYSTVLDHPLETVWSLIRDFNNYPAYIEGVSESVIEDERHGDEVGAIRRFCYLGLWVRQRLAAHSDAAHSLTYAGIEPLPFPPELASQAVSPVHYEGTMSLREITEGSRTLIEWSVALDAEPQDANRWHALFESWIPDWTDSLVRTLARQV
jgi:hypothetical protein